jgi:hypothetical protein
MPQGNHPPAPGPRSHATAGSFQLTTDGFNAYPDAVEYNFGARAEYAQLVKEFGSERANWTLRGHLRRMTRLSNSFSQQRANLRAALALFFAYYNLVKVHSAIRMTPAMKADVTRRSWTRADLLAAAAPHC